MSAVFETVIVEGPVVSQTMIGHQLLPNMVEAYPLHKDGVIVGVFGYSNYRPEHFSIELHFEMLRSGALTKEMLAAMFQIAFGRTVKRINCIMLKRNKRILNLAKNCGAVFEGTLVKAFEGKEDLRIARLTPHGWRRSKRYYNFEPEPRRATLYSQGGQFKLSFHDGTSERPFRRGPRSAGAEPRQSKSSAGSA